MSYLQRDHSKQHTDTETGQGLVEYALLLALVSAVVLLVLSVPGTFLKGGYCRIILELDSQNAMCLADDDDSASPLVVTETNYNGSQNWLDIKATYNGGHDAAVTVLANGLSMSKQGNHYHIRITSITCPCTVTVSSSTGESVDINPE